MPPPAMRTGRRSMSRLAARGASPAAFDGRCIPAGGVAPHSNTPGILNRRALPAGRLARLGATRDLHHGLLPPRPVRGGGSSDPRPLRSGGLQPRDLFVAAGLQTRRRDTVDRVRARTTPQKRPLKTLERVLSKAGVGSRTEARSWIHAGRVTVNDEATRNPDQWVDLQRDRVRFDGKPLEVRERVYVLLYKPTGYLTTYKDPEGRPTVYDLVKDVGTFLSPVGRLDLDTSGLLLMTNDNGLAEHVTNPASHVPKTYLVTASPALSDAQLQRLRDGIELSDGPTRPAQVTRVGDSAKYTNVEITLTEGRNRQIRRMIEALGARVL